MGKLYDYECPRCLERYNGVEVVPYIVCIKCQDKNVIQRLEVLNAEFRRRESQDSKPAS